MIITLRIRLLSGCRTFSMHLLFTYHMEDNGGVGARRSIGLKEPVSLTHGLGKSCLSKNLQLAMSLKILYFKVQVSVLAGPSYFSAALVIPVRGATTPASSVLQPSKQILQR